MKKALIAIVALTATFSLSGCWRPYPVPEYVEINTNQTAFVVPLDGDFKEQGKLDSVKAYEEHKVMAKRIQVEKRWLQTGYEFLGMPCGEWIPTVQVFVVDRSPQARHWTSGKDTGTKQADQSFKLQSKDGVRFFVDYNCTGNILEEDASKFLYYYPYTGSRLDKEGHEVEESALFTSLAAIMDTEIWSMVQVYSSEFSAKHPMEELKAKKSEMDAYVREGVVKFFQERGITITTLGIAGDFNYVNESVQKAIDEIFISQQQLEMEQATLNSMPNKIARMTSEGISEANKIYQAAIGEADAIKNRAQGESSEIVNQAKGQAQAVSSIAEACRQAEGNPLFIPTKEMQIEMARIKKWDSGVPKVILGDKSAPLNFMNLDRFINTKPNEAAAPAK
jgi:hypothetical protein